MTTPPDMELVAREVPPGWTNLAIGEPVVVTRAFRTVYPVPRGENFQYPPCEGLPEAREAVQEALSRLGISGEVVITNGGKQALEASFYALRKVYGVTAIDAPAPYWPCLPTLAGLTGLEWNGSGDAEVLVWPNNPDGHRRRDFLDISNDIPHRVWDAAYASPVYGWDGSRPAHYDIGLSSMSKLFGASGVRVGWAWSEDPDLVAAMAEYMELTTSGVSVLAQQFLIDFAYTAFEKGPAYRGATQVAARDIRANRDVFHRHLDSHVEFAYGAPDRSTSGGGMFAWFKAQDPERFSEAVKAAKVQLVSGYNCGATPGWYRMNLAVMPDTLNSALLRLDKELRR